MGIKEIISSLAVVIGIGGVITAADYHMSKQVDRHSIRVASKVVREEEVYKKLMSSEYTNQGKSFYGKIGVGIRKTLDIGNADVAYLTQPTSISYSTQGGIFFKPKNITTQIKADTTSMIPIISSTDIANVGDTLEFEPFQSENFLERLLGKSPKSLNLNTGENSEQYTSPLRNPRYLKKI